LKAEQAETKLTKCRLTSVQRLDLDVSAFAGSVSPLSRWTKQTGDP